MNIDEKFTIKALQRHVENLAKSAGMIGAVHLDPEISGGNNRVFQLKIGKCRYLLKQYFHHEGDPRDRLGNEFSFMSFAWNRGIKEIPEPIVCDRETNLAIYEFVNGRRLESGEVSEIHVQKAIDFFLNLNLHRNNPDAEKLPDASEASFSLKDHLLTVEERLDRLKEMRQEDAVSDEAAAFIQGKLLPAWREIHEEMLKQTTLAGLDPDRYISVGDRCISPSDFGFHNAILEENKRLRFIDFEYAGWDDPAKVVSDFFCQPAVPVPVRLFNMFSEAVAGVSSDPDLSLSKMKILFPVYRIKWCCIMLNDFLPVGDKRRSFSMKSNQTNRKRRQLEKVKAYFHNHVDRFRQMEI
jgi:hypothetical protein